MRKLAIDLGKKNTGFAISDKTNTIALPIETFSQKNANYLLIIERVKFFLKQYSIDTIILGYPLKINNIKSTSTIFVENFKKYLEKSINIPIIYVNEYNSSNIANNFLLQANISRVKRKKHVDKIAAQVILNDYLNGFFNKERKNE